MEKIIKIDGKEVRLKSSAALPLKYKAQFGRDIFADMDRREGDSLDTEFMYNVIWALAKCADDTIPPVIDWLDGFEEFPVFKIFTDANDLVMRSIGLTEKNAKAAAGK